MRHLPTATIAAAATLLLPACAAAVPQPSHPPAAQCAQARVAARQLALIPSHFTAVTTPHSLTAADKQLGLPIATSSTSTTIESYLVPNVKSPTLSRELRQAEADYKTFWAAWSTTSPTTASARAVGTAARNVIRD